MWPVAQNKYVENGSNQEVFLGSKEDNVNLTYISN